MDSSPKLQLISIAFAFMAIVTTRIHIYRKRTTTWIRGSMNRTWSSQLTSRLTNSLKMELLQNLLHLDFVAEHIEVDTCHVFLLIETEASPPSFLEKNDLDISILTSAEHPRVPGTPAKFRHDLNSGLRQ